MRMDVPACRGGECDLRVSLLRRRKLSAIRRHQPANPSNLNPTGATTVRPRLLTMTGSIKMKATQLISPRTVAVVVGLVGMVSLAIGAHAALNKRALDAAKA